MLVVEFAIEHPELPSLVLSVQGCCYNQLVMYNITCVMQIIHCQCPVYYYVHMSRTVEKLFRSQALSAAMRQYRGWCTDSGDS